MLKKPVAVAVTTAAATAAAVVRGTRLAFEKLEESRAITALAEENFMVPPRESHAWQPDPSVEAVRTAKTVRCLEGLILGMVGTEKRGLSKRDLILFVPRGNLIN